MHVVIPHALCLGYTVSAQLGMGVAGYATWLQIDVPHGASWLCYIRPDGYGRYCIASVSTSTLQTWRSIAPNANVPVASNSSQIRQTCCSLFTLRSAAHCVQHRDCEHASSSMDRHSLMLPAQLSGCLSCRIGHNQPEQRCTAFCRLPSTDPDASDEGLTAP